MGNFFLKNIKISFFIKKYANCFLLLTGIIGILYLGFVFFIDAYTKSSHFDGYPANGAFQIYNPLRRIADGQIPGHDFQFFHGLGVVYLHYPFFVFFGKSLFASEMSRHILSPLIFFISSFLFFYVCTKKISLSIFFVCFLGYSTEYILEYIIHGRNSLLGIRSTLPILTGSCIIFVLDKYAKIFSAKGWMLYCIAVCIFLSLAFFCGTEQGIASIIAYCIFHFFYINSLKNFKKAFYETCGILLLCIFNILLIFLFVSGKSFLEPIKYNLLEVPKDQFWYFGVPPNYFLYSFYDLINIDYVFVKFIFSILYGFLILVLLIYNFKTNFSYKLYGISFLFLYGSISLISVFAIHNNAYSEPFFRIQILVALYFFQDSVGKFFTDMNNKMLSKKSFLCLFYNSIPIIFFLSFLFKPFFPDALQSLENLSHKKQLHEKKILGSYLDPLWYEHFRLLEKHIPIPLFFSSIPMDEDGFQNGISKDSTSLFVEYSKKAADSVQEGKYVHFKKSGKRKIEKVEIAWKPIYGIRRKYIKLYLEGTILSPYEDGYPYRIFLLDKDENKPTVWSTYSGIVEALLEVHNPDTDYIIHALGEKRRDKYVESFKKTKCDYAITIKNKWIYGNWLLSSNWDFYEQLVYNYDILCIAPSHVIWKKKKDAFLENQEQWEGTFRNLEDKKEFTLPLNRDGDNYDIIIIEAEYSIENPWKFFPFFNNFPRYFIDPVNASAKQTISLPPYKKVFRFPIFIKNKENPKLEFYVRSLLPGASLKIKEIRYRYFHAPQKTKEILFGIFE